MLNGVAKVKNGRRFVERPFKAAMPAFERAFRKMPARMQPAEGPGGGLNAYGRPTAKR
jgi:hypothetical protein